MEMKFLLHNGISNVEISVSAFSHRLAETSPLPNERGEKREERREKREERGERKKCSFYFAGLTHCLTRAF